MRKLTILMLAILIVPISFAQIMQLEYNSNSESFFIIPHVYNHYSQYTDDFQLDTDFYPEKRLQVLGPGGSVLYEDVVADLDYYKVLPGFTGFRIIQDDGSVFDQMIDLCDNDGVCEPCDGSGCTLAESSAVCSDCASGSRDLYCDLKKDGICDPDCQGTDADCPGCGPCYYDDMTCESAGGQLCEFDDVCVNGLFDEGLRDVDTYRACCMGRCGSLLESLEIEARSTYHPEYFAINTTETPVPCKDAGGVICDWTAECNGEWVYTSDDYLCCRGSCYDPSPKDTEPLTDEEQAAFDEINDVYSVADLETPLVAGSAKVSEFDINFDPAKVESRVGEEQDLEASYDSIQIGSAVIDDTRDSELYILGFRPLTFFISLGLVLIAIIISLVVMIAKEHRRPTPAVKSNEDLQTDIDSLISQGYNYRQVQDVLVGRGYGANLVNQEIKKHYNRRRP